MPHTNLSKLGKVCNKNYTVHSKFGQEITYLSGFYLIQVQKLGPGCGLPGLRLVAVAAPNIAMSLAPWLAPNKDSESRFLT
jgi:hypothetical protein